MKKKFQLYFNFSKKEMNGILVLCLIIMLILLFPTIYKRFEKPRAYQFGDFDRDMKEFISSAQKTSPRDYHNVREEIEESDRRPAYFIFDPNKLPEQSWRKLGLSVRQVRVIKNYESKGGRFYDKEDLRKIYSISESQYLLLEPYIRINTNKRSASDRLKVHTGNKYPGIYRPSAPRTIAVVELNGADSAALESIRGIGPAFASRIIKYRKRLGGFFKKEQLLDVYGLDSAMFEGLKQQVRVDGAAIQTIDINKAGFPELKDHPYLTYKQINAIVQYRKQHGNYHSFEDLKKIAIINDEILRKIEPYLTFNDPD